MGAQTKIVITHDVADVAGDLQSKGITANNGKMQHANWLQNLLNRLAGGASNGTLITTIDKGDGVAASGTLTLSTVVATNTCSVNGTTFTAVASGATGNQFNVGANDTATAVNLAAAINASATANVSGAVIATSATNVVTIKAVVVGPIGNQCLISGGQATIVASGANLSGGAAATGSVSTASYAFGL